MCFSPQADLIGGIVISGIGIDAIRHVNRRADHITLAALPIILGAHQFVESFVWWGLQGHVSHDVSEVALWIYLLTAFVFLPVFVPTAVMRSEPTRERRLLMAPFIIIGAGVAIVLLVAMIRYPISVHLRPHHLGYSIHLHDTLLVISLYVVAVCGAFLLSGYRHMVIFGFVNLVAIGVIAYLTVDGFASVWCGWAAVSSAAIALKMRWNDPHDHPRRAHGLAKSQAVPSPISN